MKLFNPGTETFATAYMLSFNSYRVMDLYVRVVLIQGFQGIVLGVNTCNSSYSRPTHHSKSSTKLVRFEIELAITRSLLIMEACPGAYYLL